MRMIRGYHRPSTLEEALLLLSRSDIATVPLGGGTALNGLPAAAADEVVDLQGLALSDIAQSGANLSCGATTTLQALIDHPVTPALLRDLAVREAPRTIRNAATLGGTIAAGDAESVLLAGLLAYTALVTVVNSDGSDQIALARLLGDRSLLAGGLITAVSWDVTGVGAFASTGRTPADTPIVLVAGRRSDDGTVTMAATGVAATPAVIELDRVADLDPPGDFRGTPAYRRHLVTTLGARVRDGLQAGGVA